MSRSFVPARTVERRRDQGAVVLPARPVGRGREAEERDDGDRRGCADAGRASDRPPRDASPAGELHRHGEPLVRRRAHGFGDVPDASSRSRCTIRTARGGRRRACARTATARRRAAPRRSAACARIRVAGRHALHGQTIRAASELGARGVPPRCPTRSRTPSARSREANRAVDDDPEGDEPDPEADEDPGGGDRVLALALRRLADAPRIETPTPNMPVTASASSAPRGRSGPRMPAKKPSTRRNAPTT